MQPALVYVQLPKYGVEKKIDQFKNENLCFAKNQNVEIFSANF